MEGAISGETCLVRISSRRQKSGKRLEIAAERCTFVIEALQADRASLPAAGRDSHHPTVVHPAVGPNAGARAARQRVSASARIEPAPRKIAVRMVFEHIPAHAGEHRRLSSSIRGTVYPSRYVEVNRIYSEMREFTIPENFPSAWQNAYILLIIATVCYCEKAPLANVRSARAVNSVERWHRVVYCTRLRIGTVG